MIKILINDEEVLCDKELTIEEQMLSTSSIILNNVFPKSWETDKDYVRKFYYPKDYSKCLIKDVNVIQPEAGETATGQNLNIDVDITKEWDYQLLGNAAQQTYTGKNLFNSELTNQKLGGVDVSYNPSDGTLTFNGTATSTQNAYLFTNYPSGTTMALLEANKRYIASLRSFSGTYTPNSQVSEHSSIQFWQPWNFSFQLWFDKLSNGLYYFSRDTTSQVNLNRIQMKIVQGDVFDNFTIGVQFEQNNAVTSFEPYVGGQASPNPEYPQNINVVTGIQTINVNGTNFTIDLGSMELCEIDDNQDYIYKQDNKWYLTNKINKISSYNGETINTSYKSTTGQLTTGATIYYVLETPTTTEITDTDLIEQLNALTLDSGNNNITITGNIASFLKIHYNYVTGGDVENLIFAGIVKNTGNISLNPRYPHYCSVQVLSFSDFLSTGDTLDFVISEKTVLQAIQMVVDTVSQYGFVLGNVNIIGADDVIGAYSTLNKTAYDVFQYLANITQSRWTTRMIDETTVAIDFYDPTLMPVGTEIDYTTEWFEQYGINDMTFNYGTYDYRNKQIMLSDEVYADIDYTETVIGDGYNKTFLTSSNIALIKSILVNGVEATFATKEDKEQGIDADFYFTAGSNEIESDTTYTSGTAITITYTPLVQGRQVVYNSAEVSRITNQLDRRGVVTRYENRNDVLSSAELIQIGQSYIKYKGYPEINLTVDTLNNIWEIGQTVFFNAPLTELTTDYMVKTKKTLIIPTANKVFYTYTLTSSFNSENEINYFDNQRSKNAGNISAGEYITRNIDIENTANIIFSNLSVTEITVDGDNVLDSVLDSPFTQ